MSLIQDITDKIKILKLASQIPTSLNFTTPLAQDEALVLIELEGVEKINECFVFNLTCVAPKFDLDVNKLLAQEVCVAFRYGDQNEQIRYVHGIIGEIRQGATNVDDLDKSGVLKPKTIHVSQTINGESINKEVIIPTPETTIYLKVYPALWTTQFTKNCKIFQQQSALDIIKSVLGEHKLIQKVQYNNTSCGNQVREYCTQYNESDYDFVTRLMAEDGLFFYHTHSQTGVTLVIADAQTTHTDIASPQKVQIQKHSTKSPLPNQLQTIELCSQPTTDNIALTDYNYLTPSTDLYSLQGQKTPVSRVYQYTGQFSDTDGGNKKTRQYLESYAWQKSLVQGSSTIFSFQAGSAFTISNHVRTDANKKYVLHTVKHHMSIDPKKDTLTYQNWYVAFDYEAPYRNKPIINKPIIPSTQTAIVTGKDGEEIWTDEFGRIKVQFHWDQDGKKNEQTTCWIRVQQIWAGSDWGFLFTPRIGMEVVVSFVNGDPDRPLVTGCVYNQENKPPSVKEDPKRSTIRTKSTKKDTKGRFHELTFDDTLDTERIYLHSSYNVDVDIQNKRATDIHDSHDLTTIHAAKGDQANQVLSLTQGNRMVTLDKGDHFHILQQGNYNNLFNQGDAVEVLTQGNKLTALTKGDELRTIGGDLGVLCNQIGIACGGISLKASSGGGSGGAVSITAAQQPADQRPDGNAIPSIAPPTNPASSADSAKVKSQIDSLDVETTISSGNMSLTINGGNRKTSISGDDTTKVSGNYELDVTGNLTIKVTGDLTISAASISLKSTMATAVKAGTSLDLDSTTTWSASGLAMDLSAKTTFSAAGSAQASVKGGGLLALSGGAIKLN